MRIIRRGRDRLSLALQGGGAHGAFTWGVLVRLLEEDVRIDGVSGTSAGALNAVVLASGWLSGGAAGATRALDELWREIGRLAQMNPLRAGGLARIAADVATQFLSPHQLNPWGLNPLRSVLNGLVDFEGLRAAAAPRLFVAATNVLSGRARIFTNADLSSAVILASTCLPQLHPAVEIDGAPYWDGGFSANPPLLPLIEGCRARDVVLVQINPLAAERVPRTPREIRDRVAEIAFGRPLADELLRLRDASAGALWPFAWIRQRRRRLARHRLHAIDGSAELGKLDPRTKVEPTWPLLLELRARGWAAADAWLRQQSRGVPSTAPPARASIGLRPKHAGGRGSKRRRTA
ncbi:MAG: patatin-like phospholipase family protein [Geminicoccaceae bacterium]